MADRLEHETFSRHLNTKFRISVDEANAFDAELSQVHELLISPRQERFSVVFRGPREFVVPQGNYRFNHDEMGDFSLFIVPTSQNDEGTFYEAVFNRVRPD